MSKHWKVGDKVLCIETHSERLVIAGNEYVIDGFVCCESCGKNGVYIVGQYDMKNMVCRSCKFKIPRRQSFDKSRFIKPDIESLTAYQSEVTVREISVPKELTELKNLQNT